MITALNYDFRDMKSTPLQLLSCIQYLKPLWNNYHYYIKVLHYLYYKHNISSVIHTTAKHSFASKSSNLWSWFMAERINFFTFYTQISLNVYRTCTWKVKNHFHHNQLLLGCMAKDHLAFVHNPERDLWHNQDLKNWQEKFVTHGNKKEVTINNMQHITFYQQIFIPGTFSNGCDQVIAQPEFWKVDSNAWNTYHVTSLSKGF